MGAPAILNNPPRHATPNVAPTSSTPLGPLWASETDAGVSPGRRLLLAVIAASPLVEMPRAERVARAPSRLPRKCLEARVSAELIEENGHAAGRLPPRGVVGSSNSACLLLPGWSWGPIGMP